MHRDNLNEWMDRQEELAAEERLKAAIEAATAAGVDVQKVMKGAVDTYKMLHKSWGVSVETNTTTKIKPFAGALGQLIEQGVRTERDFIIHCLKGHIEKARNGK